MRRSTTTTTGSVSGGQVTPDPGTTASDPEGDKRRLLSRILQHYREHRAEVFISLEALRESHPELFEHISEGGIEKLAKFISYLAEAKGLVLAKLSAHPDYDASSWTDAYGDWANVSLLNTIVKGVEHHERVVTLIVRPSHFDMVIFYGRDEIDRLADDDTQVWVGGGSSPAHHLTLGRLLRALSIDRLPLSLTGAMMSGGDPRIVES